MLDIIGASGAVYRFRLHRPGQALPATAGNYVYVQAGSRPPVILCCGEASSLVQAGNAARDVEEGAALYLRLNVSRATRVAEHEDIVAAAAPALVLRGTPE